MRYQKGFQRKIITVLLGLVSLFWAVQAWYESAVADVIFGLLFTAYSIFALVRLSRKKSMQKQTQKTHKTVSPFYAACKRIARNAAQSDLILYFFVLYVIVCAVLPRVLNGFSMPSLYELIGLVIFFSGFFQAVKQVFGWDKYSASESRRAWDIYDATHEQEAEPASGAVCPHCGKPVKGKEVFCKSCGQSMYTSEPTINMFICPRCKQPVGPDDSVCTGCGNLFIDTTEEETSNVD